MKMVGALYALLGLAGAFAAGLMVQRRHPSVVSTILGLLVGFALLLCAVAAFRART